ncbi:hypothetical protein VTO42DRAFT_2762 [Malbranchea cinnamomea]
MLAIVKAFTHWRHYLEGSRYLVEILTDHANLRSFMKPSTKIAQRRHASPILWTDPRVGLTINVARRTLVFQRTG